MSFACAANVLFAAALCLPSPSVALASEPQLRVVSVTMPARVHTDEVVEVDWTVRNDGAAPGARPEYTVLLSMNAVLTLNDEPIAHGDFAIGADEVVDRSDSVDLSQFWLRAGRYTYGLYLHSGGELAGGEITLIEPVALAGVQLPDATVGTSYCATIAAAGGDGTYAWTYDAAPAGMAWSEAGSELELCGMPVSDGTFVFDVTVASAGRESSASYQLEIQPAPPPPAFSCAAAVLPTCNVGDSVQGQLSAGNGTTPLVFRSLDTERLAESWFPGAHFTGQPPPGLVLSQSGAISGAPLAAGTYLWAVEVEDAGGQIATCAVTLDVDVPGALVLGPTNLPSITADAAYSTNLSATGGAGQVEFAVAPGSSLPPGLALADDGTLAGTVAESDLRGQPSRSYTFDVRAFDEENRFSAATLTVELLPPPTPAVPEEPQEPTGEGDEEAGPPAGGSAPPEGCSAGAGPMSFLALGLVLLGLRRRS